MATRYNGIATSHIKSCLFAKLDVEKNLLCHTYVLFLWDCSNHVSSQKERVFYAIMTNTSVRVLGGQKNEEKNPDGDIWE